MALSDGEKFDLVRRAIADWVLSFSDWPSLKAGLQSITKAGLKSFILNAIQAEVDKDLSASTGKAEMHTEITSDI